MAIMLGWMQLRHQKVRLVVAISGIAFAVILILAEIAVTESQDATVCLATPLQRYEDGAVQARVLYHLPALGDQTVRCTDRAYLKPVDEELRAGAERGSVREVIGAGVGGGSERPQRLAVDVDHLRHRIPRGPAALNPIADVVARRAEIRPRAFRTTMSPY